MVGIAEAELHSLEAVFGLPTEGLQTPESRRQLRAKIHAALESEGEVIRDGDWSWSLTTHLPNTVATLRRCGLEVVATGAGAQGGNSFTDHDPLMSRRREHLRNLPNRYSLWGISASEQTTARAQYQGAQGTPFLHPVDNSTHRSYRKKLYAKRVANQPATTHWWSWFMQNVSLNSFLSRGAIVSLRQKSL